MVGVVSEFDDHRGYGTVRPDEGRELFFHCTRLTDGTRTIDPGQRVAFVVVPGHGGRWEASEVEKV